MSRIPAKAGELKRSASTLRSAADRLTDSPSRLLLFYSVECGLKERYLVNRLDRRPYDDTSVLEEDEGPFGRTGHDLGAASKALRIPALSEKPPHLLVHGQAKSVEYAHQVWRYGIGCSGAEDVEAWLYSISRWLEDNR